MISDNLIDNLINAKIYNEEILLTDHRLVTIEILIMPKAEPVEIIKNKIKKLNIATLKDEETSQIFKEEITSKMRKNPTNKYTEWQEIIKTTAIETLGYKKIENEEEDTQKQPYIGEKKIIKWKKHKSTLTKAYIKIQEDKMLTKEQYKNTNQVLREYKKTTLHFNMSRQEKMNALNEGTKLLQNFIGLKSKNAKP